ncbi:hypothetical protein H7849_09015 [Alloacidobacterium dinghuense]|uniref:Uncharacterized protein n=1 Tax=Alloacidobacterium dinghuense TaxID=2763107 RepID=A0A7G8BNA1_9BACT|nr:hypothetical protein [Alloacidobacterium dinghuense]QNI34021.1 hypothetical protein H7849_09015 [Alloacidobacterium dinghuense]
MLISRSKFLSLGLVLVGLAVAGAGVASAQDVYKVNYFDFNAPVLAGFPVPDATVRIDNPGLTYGNLCAMIYVFAADQQLAECCGCVETHNGLRRLSVRTDLTKNPLTGPGTSPFSGVIKVISAAVNNSPCDPTANVTPKANLRVWATHIQPGTAFGSFGGIIWPVTETESSDSTLGATELANLQAQCSFINILGSGAGICTCGTGD